MELLKLILVVTAVAISTCPRSSHSMTLFYYPQILNGTNDTSSFSLGVGLYKDGQNGIVCDEGDTDTVEFLCNNFVSFGDGSFVSDPSILNVSFTNYNCPSGLSSCGEAASIISNCTSSPLIIECSFSNCSPGQVQLTNTVNISTDSGVAFVGYPEVCVNGNFTPICNGTELGATELMFICAYQSINSSSSLIGNPHNVQLSPLMSSSASSVTGYDCDTMANCTVTTGMNCTSGYLIVTCEGFIPNRTACDSSAYANGSILFNSNTTESEDDSIITTGIYQACIDGSYVRYCTDPSQWAYPSIVNLVNGLCQSLGFSFGVIVPLEERFSQGSPPGILAININCSSEEGSQCNNNTLCNDINRQMVLRCTKSPDCALTGSYLYNNITTIRDGRQYIVRPRLTRQYTSGIIVNCESGFYMAFCGTNGNNLSDLCSSGILGYEGGKVLSYNSTVHGVLPLNTAFFTNLDCPSNATSINDCSAKSLNSTTCNNTLVLECYRDIVISSSTVTSTVTTSTIISTSSSPTSSSTPTSDSGASVGAIVGGSVGGVIAVIVIITILVIAVLMYMKKHKSPVVPISEKKSHPI